ncbi:MLX-interacting protein [Frankliniella fusca]|uniref:MLX-interacting protein n=1 Tax=Frankliniella fusca TaxID=407009 RepID=A0AAE1HZB6_9NEOP|nr:MLX-interacting protein [Frankliniella fusca]
MMMYHKMSGSGMTTTVVKEKEAIHSGHFMVSHFEAEEQDDEDEVAVPVPEDLDVPSSRQAYSRSASIHLNFQPAPVHRRGPGDDSQGVGGENACTTLATLKKESGQTLSIETSLSKLFQCMSLAYR